MQGMRDIFNSLSGIWEIMTTQLFVLAANAIHQGESSCFSYQLSKLRYALSDLVNDCLTEMVS